MILRKRDNNEIMENNGLAFGNGGPDGIMR